MLDFKSIKYFKLAVCANSYIERNNDIACRCPVCGDSKTNKSSKRLHLYKKGTGDTDFVNCFNGGCSVQNKTIYTFLRDFYPELLQSYKTETFKSKINSLKSVKSLKEISTDTSINETDWTNSTIAKLEDNTDSTDSTDSTDEFSSEALTQSNLTCDWINSEIVNTQTIEIGPVLYDLSTYFTELTEPYLTYLHNRGLNPHFNNKWYIGKTNIEINSIKYNIKDYLIIPLYKNNLMYGFYSRSIKDKKFITFVSTLGYKVWNWYNIDKTKDCYIFEGIFDAISTGLTNIIANLGAELPKDRLDELQNPIFCLDNDKTGLENSIKYAKQGYKVYIQPNNYLEKDFNELKLNNPGLNISELINSNLYSGISAITRIKAKL